MSHEHNALNPPQLLCAYVPLFELPVIQTMMNFCSPSTVLLLDLLIDPHCSFCHSHTLYLLKVILQKVG